MPRKKEKEKDMSVEYVDGGGIVLTENAIDKHRKKCPDGNFCKGEECEFWDAVEPEMLIRGQVAGYCMKEKGNA